MPVGPGTPSGKGLDPVTLARMNGLLSEPARHQAGHYLRDGRMGMWMVAEYVRVLGFSVRIQPSFHGGTLAEVRVPLGLLTAQERAARGPPVRRSPRLR